MGERLEMTDSDICTIICGAPCKEFPREKVRGFVIAADRGLDYALAAGITPDLVVGDFDSAKTEIPSGIQCVRVSPIKDDTDAALAAELAVKKGFRELRFLCALGGRLDHSIANIQLLYGLKKHGENGIMYGDNTELFLAYDECVEIPRFDGFVSVFSYTADCIVSEQGMKYPLTEKLLTNDLTLGVSNEITEETARITVHSGTALIIKVTEK